MRKAGIFFFGAMMAVGSILGAGCGGTESGDTSTTGTGGSTSTTTPTTTSGGNDTTTGGNDGASSSASGGDAAPTCDSYCTEIMTACTGDVAQYASAETCKAACANFPAGKITDTAGDSLACRAYHANAAKAQGMAAKHCPHAGPTGGDLKVSDTEGPACGDGCEAFCDIALKACEGQATAYKDRAACVADCRSFKDIGDHYDVTFYSKPENWTNDFGCRMYHLNTAATSAENAKTHCPHAVGASTACTK